MDVRKMKRSKVVAILKSLKGLYKIIFSAAAFLLSAAAGFSPAYHSVVKDINKRIINRGLNISLIKEILSSDYYIFLLIFIIIMMFIGRIIDKRIVFTKNKYFHSVDFGIEGDEIRYRAIQGITNSERSRPFFIHSAQENIEVGVIYSYLNLKANNFCTIKGRPGEGKSLLAYQVSNMLFRKEGYKVFSLDIDNIEETEFNENTKNEIITEFDALWRRKKIIIIDDTQRLFCRENLFNFIRNEAAREKAKFIWIETELISENYDNEEPDYELNVRVNFISNFDNLLKSVAKGNCRLTGYIKDQNINSFEEAVEKVKEDRIKDYWHFIYAASDGKKRLLEKIDTLNNLELTALFIISAHSILGLEVPLYLEDLNNLLKDIIKQLKWQESEYSKSGLASLLRGLKEKTASKGSSLIEIHDVFNIEVSYVALMHFNFAKDIIKECLDKKEIIEGLHISMGRLLYYKYPQDINIDMLLKAISHNTERFVKDNSEWFEEYFNNPSEVGLMHTANALKIIGKESTILFNEVLIRMDKENVCQVLSQIKPGNLKALNDFILYSGIYAYEFINLLDLDILMPTVNYRGLNSIEKLSYLIDFLGIRKEEFLDKLDLNKLIYEIGELKSIPIHQICHLISILDSRREEFIKRLDMDKFTLQAGRLSSENVKQIVYLINNFGSRAEEFIDELEIERLAKTASSLEIRDVQNISSLIDGLRKRTKEFIDNLDLVKLAEAANNARIFDLQNIANLIKRLGHRREEFIRKLNLEKLGELSREARIDDIIHISNFADRLSEYKLVFIKALKFDKLLTELLKVTDINFFQFYYLIRIMNFTDKEYIGEAHLELIIRAANEMEFKNLHQLQGLIMFSSILREKSKIEFITDVDWLRLIDMALRGGKTNFDIIVNLINNSLYKLEHKSQKVMESEKNRLIAYLKSNSEKIKQMIKKYNGSNYDLIGEVFLKVKVLKDEMPEDIIDLETALELGRNIKINPGLYNKVSVFINCLRKMDAGIALGFVSNNRILERFIETINSDENKAYENSALKSLITAINDIAPSLWQYMRKYLKEDFNYVKP